MNNVDHDTSSQMTLKRHISLSQLLELVPISRSTFDRMKLKGKTPPMKRIGGKYFCEEGAAQKWADSFLEGEGV